MENENKEYILRVYGALQEKGYNAVGQIVGYLLTEDPTYITNHLGARNLIRKIDRYSLLADIVAAYFDDTEGESGGRPAAGPPECAVPQFQSALHRGRKKSGGFPILGKAPVA